MKYEDEEMMRHEVEEVGIHVKIEEFWTLCAYLGYLLTLSERWTGPKNFSI